MDDRPTLARRPTARRLSFLCGLGMIAASVLTIQHFFAANFPTPLFEGSMGDINQFFNCASSAHSAIAHIAGVPLGYFGLVVGALVTLGALFPSDAFERTNKSIALLNGLGVLGLAVFSVGYLRSFCLLGGLYYLFAIASLFVFWRYGVNRGQAGFWSRTFRPSIKHLVVFAVAGLMGAYGFALYHEAKKEARTGGAAARIVDQYFNLPEVHTPSILSPYWSIRATERFEDAPIQIIEYGDFLCPDSAVLFRQMQSLKDEFRGKINLAFQFFPLDGQCNHVVPKDLHRGACELSYMAAHDPAKFQAIHDEIFTQFESAPSPEWRRELARRHGVEGALEDAKTKEIVQDILLTGAEYQKTSPNFPHGVRSTPTLILNNRLVIGTFPKVHLRAIFQALVDRREKDHRRFIENWEPR